MVMLLHTLDDFWSVERTRVGLGRGCETEHAARVFFCEVRQDIGLTAKVRDFQARPLAPEIYPGGGLDQVGDKRTTYSRSDLQKVEAAVVVCADVLRMGYTASHAEFRGQPPVQCCELRPLAALP